MPFLRAAGLVAAFTLALTRGAVATTITVNGTADNAADDGICTLREAIIAANTNTASGAMPGECAAGQASPTVDTIEFDISGSGVHAIKPASELPTITEVVLIDGYTQRPCATNTEPCSRANTLAVGDDAELLIELDGTSAGSSVGLRVQASGCTVRGLVIDRFASDEIFLGNFTSNNTIAGNFLGTDPTGTSSPSTSVGIEDDFGTANTIGGTTPAARNVMASTSDQIVVNDNSGGGNDVVQGNYLGVNAAGTAALPAETGVHVVGGSVGNAIGGSAPGAGNVMGNFLVGGVYLESANDNVVAGNLIGTDATGTMVLASTLEAVRVGNGPACADNVIGGSAAGAGNVITGAAIGVDVHGGASGTVIQGNRIGTDLSGTVALGNSGCGILLESSSGSTVGGTGPGEGNVIAFNGTTGVAISTATGSRVLGNSIFSNGGLGISFTSRCDVISPPTMNDPGDADTGQNNLQNFPQLAAGIFPGGTSIDGMLNSTPSTTFRVEVFANDACDSSGNGEGHTFVGANSAVTTNASGDAAFTVNFSLTVAAGKVLTATATAPDGSTSEFGPCTATPPTTTTTTTTSTTATTTSMAPTTTTSTASTTSTTAATTTSSTAPPPTTTTTATTTSTTQPGGCATEPVGATFVSIDCRLDALIAQVSGGSALGVLQPKLLDQIQKAKTHKEKAEMLCRQASKRRTRRALRPAINKVGQFLRTLASRKGHAIPPAVRDGLGSAADAIRGDMQALQRAVQCPRDAPPA